MARSWTFAAIASAASACLPSPAAAQTASVHFDAVGMFMSAVPVVKGVMILLILASVVSWAVFVVKVRDISTGIQSVKAASDRIRGANRLTDVKGVDHATGTMIAAAVHEMEKSAPLVRQGRVDGMRARIEDELVRIEHRMVARMREGLPALASVGSVAPFVGLFGTVWGIMHSFVGIADAKSTSLAVVAPGIAEALLATALGLVAAIPATIMYNLLGRRMAVYRQSLGDSATLLACLIGRDIELEALSAAYIDAPLQRRGG